MSKRSRSNLSSNSIGVEKFYYFLPLLLFIFQLVLTLNSFGQIRYEELAESVRNPYWLEHRKIYDGISSNIGWYGLVLGYYKVFGFNLFAGKIIRLTLHLISIYCLAAILKKYLGAKLAWLPLVAAALSPTLLYFNTLEAQYGIDLQFLPICLFLLMKADFKNFKGWLFAGLFSATAMVAWMSYPTFLYYLPALFIYFGVKVLKEQKINPEIFKKAGFGLLAFLAPLFVGILYVTNRQTLILDSTSGSGLFRGAGVLKVDSAVFFSNLKFNLVNLFGKAFGYNFEISKAEFSDVYPFLALFAVFFVIWRQFFSKRQLRLSIFLIGLIAVLNIVIAYFSVDPLPGLRRTTGILAAIYGFYTVAWFGVWKMPSKERFLRNILVFGLLLLPLHHLVVYPLNLSHIADRSLFADLSLNSGGQSPKLILSGLVEAVQKQEINLICPEEINKKGQCRYTEIYAAISGECLWDRLNCRQVNFFDYKTGEMVKFSRELDPNFSW